MIEKDYYKYMASMINGSNKDCTGNHYNDCKTALTEILKQIEEENKYVGLKDIEGNKIYADNSILEINFNPYCNKEVTIYGYISYVSERLRYEFFQYFEARKNFIPAYIDFQKDNRMKHIKIIDTIRKNKEHDKLNYHKEIICKIESVENA